MDLSKYGLSTYESAAYTMLVRSGLSTAHEISGISGVPDGKIYPILRSLERKGFVKLYAGTPKRFVAIDPKIAIEESVRKKQEEMLRIKDHAQHIIKELGAMSAKKESEPLDSVHIIEGYKNYLNLSVELHKKAKKHWYSISRIPLYQPHLESYTSCVKRKVDVRILTALTPDNEKNLIHWKKTGARLRITGFLPTRFSVIDDTDVVIRISGEKRYLALWIQNPSLAASMKRYFEILWQEAKKV